MGDDSQHTADSYCLRAAELAADHFPFAFILVPSVTDRPKSGVDMYTIFW